MLAFFIEPQLNSRFCSFFPHFKIYFSVVNNSLVLASTQNICDRPFLLRPSRDLHRRPELGLRLVLMLRPDRVPRRQVYFGRLPRQQRDLSSPRTNSLSTSQKHDLKQTLFCRYNAKFYQDTFRVSKLHSTNYVFKLYFDNYKTVLTKLIIIKR